MADNRKIIEEINRYCSPKSLLLIDRKGILRRLDCPFKAIVKRPAHYLQIDEIVEILAVKISSDLVLLFVVHQYAYPYYIFTIPKQWED